MVLDETWIDAVAIPAGHGQSGTDCPEIVEHVARYSPREALRRAQVVEELVARVAQLEAERDRLREQRDHEAWMHAACLTLAETGASWFDGAQHSAATEAVMKLKAERDRLAGQVERVRRWR